MNRSRNPSLKIQESVQLVQPPFQEIPTLNTATKQLTDLIKLYYNDESKFGGGKYDILDTKLRIFYDNCTKVGISDSQYHKAFSVMLKEQAATFYYDRLSNRNYRFDDIIVITRIYFETEENRQFYMAEWKEITLLKICQDNLEKTRLKCLELMFNKFQKIQRGLSAIY